MEDIFREVDEEVRREQYLRLWKAYGKYVVAAAVLVVALAGGYTGWREYQKRQAFAAAEAYAVALGQEREGKSADAAAAFRLLSAEAPAGYRTLSLMQHAAALAQGGEFDKAVAAYDEIAASGAVDQTFRDLARVLAGLILVDRAPRPAVEEKVRTVAEGNSPFRHTAREVLALAALKAGDVASARSGLTALADDQAAPPNIRARAAELLAAVPEQK